MLTELWPQGVEAGVVPPGGGTRRARSGLRSAGGASRWVPVSTTRGPAPPPPSTRPTGLAGQGPGPRRHLHTFRAAGRVCPVSTGVSRGCGTWASTRPMRAGTSPAGQPGPGDPAPGRRRDPQALRGRRGHHAVRGQDARRQRGRVGRRASPRRRSSSATQQGLDALGTLRHRPGRRGLPRRPPRHRGRPLPAARRCAPILTDRHPVQYVAKFVRPLLRGQVRSDHDYIEHHYENDPDFFLSFLDRRHRAYSQGVFEHPDEPLEDGITRKLDYALDAIGVGPGARVLDIGGGWGAFVEYGGRHGLHVTSLTISEASRRIRAGDHRRPGAALRDPPRALLRPPARPARTTRSSTSASPSTCPTTRARWRRTGRC